jgi:hypothetical protein
MSLDSKKGIFIYKTNSSEISIPLILIRSRNLLSEGV